MDANIQEYLLIKGAFDSYQINVRLRKTPVTLLPLDIIPPTVSPSVPLIVKLTILVSNILTNDLPQAPSAPASVNTSTILLSTTTYIRLPTPPTGIRPAPFKSLSASFAPSASAPGTKPTSIIKQIMNFSPVINLPAAMTIISTDYGRKLLDLAKINADETKHSGRNDTFMFKLAKL